MTRHHHALDRRTFVTGAFATGALVAAEAPCAAALPQEPEPVTTRPPAKPRSTT